MISKRKYFGSRKRKELSKFEIKSIEGYKKRFAFWQSKQLDALTFSINLIFTISIAVSGFLIANKDREFSNNMLLCDYSIVRTALFLLTLSTSIGIVGLIFRLNDLRLTKNIIRTRQRIFELENNIKYEAYRSSDRESQKLKRDSLIFWSNFFGNLTWAMFYFQVGLFLLTIWLLVLNT